VQGAAPVALVRRPLAGRALTGLCPAPLAGPIGAKAEIVTFLEPTFCHLKTYRCLGVYYFHLNLIVSIYSSIELFIYKYASMALATKFL
jgi:hypothetical protein